MGKLTVRSGSTVQRAPFHAERGRLSVATGDEKAFLAGFEEYFWVLIHSERERLVLDLTRAEGLGLTAYQMIALNLFEIGNRNKSLTIRIPPNLETYFRQARLYRTAEIEVTRVMGKTAPEEAPASAAPEPSEADRKAEDEVSQAGKRVEELMGELQKVDESSPEASRIAAEARKSLEENVSRIQQLPDEVARGDAPADATDQVPVELIRRIGKGSLIDVRTNEHVGLPPRSGGSFSVGRTPGNELQVASPLVSRKHATLTREGDRYFITDLGSGNGTYVNGVKLEPNVAKALFHGYRVVLAVTRQYPNGAKAYVFHQDEI